MARDEHGMPVPSFKRPVKRDEYEPHKIRDADGETIVYVNCAVDRDYIEHALNNAFDCIPIVRRLADGGMIGDKALMYQLWEDAARLWAKMQKEAGDGTCV